MNSPGTITRFTVNDAVMRLVDTDIDVPLSRFIVRFALNEIPHAEVVPALGKELTGGRKSELANIKEKSRARIVLTLNGTERLLFEGFVASVQADNNAGILESTLSANVLLQHNAVEIAGMPSESFVYSARTSNFETLMNQKLKAPLFGIGKEDATGPLYTLADFIQRLWEVEGDTVYNYPGRVLKFIAEKMTEEFNAEMETAVDVSDLIRIYDPANFSKIGLVPEDFLGKLADRFVANWRSGNVWSSIVDCCNYLFLKVVPFNTGFYICDPYNLDRKPAVVLTPGEFMKLSVTQASRLQETGAMLGTGLKYPNGVILESPATSGQGADDIFTFPDVTWGAGQDRGPRRYYFRRTFPDWIQPIAYMQNGAFSTTKAVTAATRNEIPQLTQKKTVDYSKQGAEDIQEFYRAVGQLLAQMVYAQTTQPQIVLKVDCPFREDLMPGTIVKLKNPADGSMSFLGDSLYGMVAATTVMCDMTSERGDFGVSVSVVNVRNEEDNADDALTLDGNPLYEGRWVGIDIYGNLLDQNYVDGFKAPKTPATDTFDGASGQIINAGFHK